MTTFLKIMLAGVAMAHLAACSKTVQWEEEVPLNTGEVIWVKRTVEYTMQGGAGNPFDMDYRPDKVQKLQFEWGGTSYVYVGEARIILLAISPMGKPALVAQADAGGWHWKHDYKCTTPFYVQFIPTEKVDRTWTWPPSIEPWIIGLSYNLMRSRHPPEDMKRRYTALQRSEEDATGSIQDPSSAKIDPAHKVNTCF